MPNKQNKQTNKASGGRKERKGKERTGQEKNTWKGTQFVGRRRRRKRRRRRRWSQFPFFFSVFGSDFVKIEVAEVKEEEEKEK
jgi:hypothetical protein